MKTISALVVLTALLAIGVLRMAGNGRSPTTSDRFTGLGDLLGGFFDSFAYGVSADGTAVVGYSNSAAGMEAFRWTPGNGMAGLGFPQAFAASADGSVVVGYRHLANRAEPVRWTRDGGIVGLGKSADDSWGAAVGVSADGSVIVGGYDPDFDPCNNIAFVWTNGGRTGRWVHLPNGVRRCDARAVSADGAVMVGATWHDSGHAEAFSLRDGGGMVRLGVLPGDSDSIANSVSADGSVIVGNSHSEVAKQAFRWTQESRMVGLGTLPDGSSNSKASGVSADGSVIVGQCYGQAGFEAFVWDAAHGMRGVREVLVSQFGLGASLRGWKLRAATAISADGSVVVGYGINPNGKREAWIACLGNEHRPFAQAAATPTVVVTRSNQ
jgi:probable HAF family extracellular repeat protein